MKNISAALIRAKSNFKPVIKNKTNPFHKSKYANLDSILEAIGEALANEGLLLIQPIETGVLVTRIIHAESGELIESSIEIPAQADPQKYGSLLTYYRRFSLCSLLAIVADDDDDGNAAKSAENNNASPKKIAAPVKSSADINAESKAIADRKKAAVECFKKLGWNDSLRKEWANKFNPLPSEDWTLGDWSDELALLRLEISKIIEAA